MIRLRTLGVLRMRLDGEEPPPELKWRKNSALLVYLARSPGRTRTREQLCGALWPDKPDASARHSLNEALRVLRKALGDRALESDARQIALDGSAIESDTDALEAAIGREAWQEAAALVQGDFLEGFALADASAFEDWLASERTLWRGRSVQALVGAADERLSEGVASAGLDLAQRALALDPFSDLAAQAAIRALALAGDRGGALSLFHDFEERLRDELGATPEPETERLADRVRRERTWRLPAALASPKNDARRVELLGRAAELERALGLWRRSQGGEGAAVISLEGEPGVGKTRLVEELAGRARLEGGTVAGIRCVPADRDLDLSGLRGLCGGGLLDAPGLLSAPPTALGTLTAELPEWRERLEWLPESAGDPFPRAFSETIRAITEEQPTLLFVDDAEWLDAPSREALVLLLRDLERAPVTLAVAAAGPEGTAVLDRMEDARSPGSLAERIVVAPWTQASCGTLVARLLPEFDHAERDRLARRVYVDSAGLPLLAVELVHAVRDGLTLDDGGLGSAWPRANQTLEESLPGDLPDSVRAAIRIGFRRLSRSAQAVVTAAAVLERGRFEAADIARLTGRDGDELTTALDELEWSRWLQAEPRGYAFVARIVRDVVGEDMLTPGQRRRLADRLTDS